MNPYPTPLIPERSPPSKLDYEFQQASRSLEEREAVAPMTEEERELFEKQVREFFGR